MQIILSRTCGPPKKVCCSERKLPFILTVHSPAASLADELYSFLLDDDDERILHMLGDAVLSTNCDRFRSTIVLLLIIIRIVTVFDEGDYGNQLLCTCIYDILLKQSILSATKGLGQGNEMRTRVLQ